MSGAEIRRLVLDAALDAGANWVYYDRKEDEELDRDAMARVWAEGLVTCEEVLEAFAEGGQMTIALAQERSKRTGPVAGDPGSSLDLLYSNAFALVTLGQRPGQALFNAVKRTSPELAETMRGTPLDTFNVCEPSGARLAPAIAHIEAAWKNGAPS